MAISRKEEHEAFRKSQKELVIAINYAKGRSWEELCNVIDRDP